MSLHVGTQDSQRARTPDQANDTTIEQASGLLDFYASKCVVFLINLILTELDYRVLNLSKNITGELCT